MATRRTGQLVQRSTATASRSPDDNPDVEPNEGYESDEAGDRKETRLTLMEEVLLLGLKDREVRTTRCVVTFVVLSKSIKSLYFSTTGLYFFLE